MLDSGRGLPRRMLGFWSLCSSVLGNVSSSHSRLRSELYPPAAAHATPGCRWPVWPLNPFCPVGAVAARLRRLDITYDFRSRKGAGQPVFAQAAADRARRLHACGWRARASAGRAWAAKSIGVPARCRDRNVTRQFPFLVTKLSPYYDQ
jgi:hypothetical protein